MCYFLKPFKKQNKTKQNKQNKTNRKTSENPNRPVVLLLQSDLLQLSPP